MKLLFAIKRLQGIAGGAERVLSELCSHLVSRGHHVALVSFDTPNSSSFFSLDKRVRRLYLPIGDSAHPARPVETFRRIMALRRTLVRERPSIAVGFMHSMFVPLAFAAMGLRIPVIGSEHIVREHYRGKPVQYGLVLLTALFLEKITVLSPAIAAQYPAVLRDRMVPISNPVNPPKSSADVRGIGARKILLTIGRLETQKNHTCLLHAFASIAAANADWDLRIIGEGSLRQSLQSLVVELGLTGRVAMPGNEREISEEYRQANLFVLPSNYESFGLAAAEAMAHGLPIVAFAVCAGINELVENDVSGLLVEGADKVQSLATALGKLMSDPDRREEMGTHAAHKSRFFLPGAVYKKWEDLILEVSTGHPLPKITSEAKQGPLP